jgi:hypothetical protein
VKLDIYYRLYGTTKDDVRFERVQPPQRMKGRWIHDGCDIPHGVDWMHCSVCGRREPYVPAAMTNFCPNCGADMRQGEGDEANDSVDM